jgi:class 3 adenylate cyclase/tetratricopeptide (TPR) repeat protein
VVTCPSCGKENPDGFEFCGFCRAALTATLSSPTREERKIVSVLFCDLVGFTSRAEQLDPEDVRALLAPYHERVRFELERHGGTVEKFIGDAVMALFGAPTAHEDDPERAVRAALAIREFALEEGLELRVGITTGEALIALGASPAEGEGMASGDVVNTAARLQSAAPVNGILADEATYRATRRAIDYGVARPVDAKGKTEPIPVWEATGARSRFGVDVTHHARAELVGREQELSVLRDAFLRARNLRAPQLVTLVAVPGMGKSRLVYELSRIVDADPELVTWRQGRCLAYGDGVAFWALAEVVKAQTGISERDTEAEAADKLHATVEDVLVDERDARWVESHLRPLVGLETEVGLGGDRRGEAFAAWRRFLEALAEQRPLVLVLEDLHWADDGLLDFVDELVDWLSGVPLLVVCSARPELLERRPGWGGGKLNASTIGLSPLSREQTALLISHVLDRSLLPAEIQQTLLERAEGNPLYAEQFAQLYLELGSAEDMPLPETLQGIVAARLDGLSAEEKAILQDASVVGKVFWTGGLHRDELDVTPLLHSLERRGFLTRQRRSSLESEGEWAFAHMLLRDVAYGQIPRADRAVKHLKTAQWIESLGRSEDHAELLAFHWSSALELTRAAGQDTTDLETPTRLALREAGSHAFAINAYPAAATYYGDALALWPEDDPNRPGLLYCHADALYVANDDRAAEALEVARDAVLGIGERDTAAEAEISLSRIAWHRGQGEEARTHEVRAEKLVEGTSSRAGALVLASIARTRAIGGDPEQGLRLASEALSVAETLGVDGLRAHSLATIGLAKGYLGDATGAEDERKALELAVAANSPFAGAIANNIGVQAWFDLDVVGARRAWDEGLRIAERLGDASSALWIRYQQETVALVDGRWAESLSAANELLAGSSDGGHHYMDVGALRDRGRIRLARGDRDGALSDLRLSVTLGRETGDPQALLAQLGALVLALDTYGVLDQARPLADELVQCVRDYPFEAWVVALDFLFARVSLPYERDLRTLLQDSPYPKWRDVAFACLDREFVHAADLWASAGSPTWEARCRLRAAEELIDSERPEDAHAQLGQAVAFYRSVGAMFFVERCESLLAGAAQSESAR